MQQQHHPKDIRTYNKGANRDTEKELLSGDEGVYVDAHNMRPTSMDGDSGSIKKIKGEVMLFPMILNSCSTISNLQNGRAIKNYCNIGTIEVNDNIVEFWANKVSDESLIRINGVVVMWDIGLPDTSKLGFSCDYPLQMDKDESCRFGTVFVTDNHIEPIYFDIEDLLVNSGMIDYKDIDDEDGNLIVRTDGVFDALGVFSKGVTAVQSNLIGKKFLDKDKPLEPTPLCSDKYFSEFNKGIFDINLESGLDIPVFVGLDDNPSGGIIKGVSGLSVGLYQYSIRYITNDGERTQWSHSTGLIPVHASSDVVGGFDGIENTGAVPDITIGQSSIHLKIRITNDFDYDFIEVRRAKYNSGDILGLISGLEVIAKIDSPEKYSVINFYDNGAEPIDTLSGEDSVGGNTIVKKAKGIRFHNNRIYLMNINESERVIDRAITTTGITMGSTIQKIGKKSHSDPKNFEKWKNNLSEEGYKYGLVGYDVNGEVTYAKPVGNPEATIDDNSNPIPLDEQIAQGILMPDRRDEITGDSLDTSYSGVVKATINTNSSDPNIRIGNTHEVFEHYDNKKKDNNQNAFVYNNSNHKFNQVAAARFPYNPACFSLDYYSKGVYIKGINNIPSRVKSFAIVRAKPIGNVVAQGIGTYHLSPAAYAFRTQRALKFYSPDTDSDISIDPLLIDNVLSNKNKLDFKLSSPLGFFSEIYNHIPIAFGNLGAQVDENVFRQSRTWKGSADWVGGDRNNSARKDASYNVDQLIYARLLRDEVDSSARINPFETSDMGIVESGDNNHYVDFGKWRNSNTKFAVKFAKDRLLKVVDIEFSPTSKTLTVELNKNIYPATNFGVPHNLNFTDERVKTFSQPFYISNLVRGRDNLSIDDSEEFQETGFYQKMESIIGTGDGKAKSLELTYERWEDVSPDILNDTRLKAIKDNDLPVEIVSTFAGNGFSNNGRGIAYQQFRRFIYIDGKAWINYASFFDAAEYQAAILSLFTNSTHLISGVTVHGIFFTSTKDNIFWNVVFKEIEIPTYKSFFIPPSGAVISIKYNDNIPIRVFGGDTTIGEVIHDTLDASQSIPLPMPYGSYNNQSRPYIGNLGYTSLNGIEDIVGTIASEGGNGTIFRQMAVMFACESRTNINFLYSPNSEEVKRDGYFPQINPQSVGGFERLEPSDVTNRSIATNPVINQDYSNDNTFRKYINKSEFSPEEVTDFCTKIIWSLPNNVNQQDTPNLRTFPALNFYSLPESTGEIKMAWSANTGRGDNLYAITEEGVSLLPTNKRVLSEASGNQLGYIGDENSGVREHLWVSKTIGMDKQFWRTAAEYEDTLYWANKESVYRFDGNALQDIGKNKYHSRIYLDYLDKIDGGYNTDGKLIEDMTGFYDRYHNEYWLNFSNYRECPQDIAGDKLSFNNGAILNTNTLVYSSLTDHWLGTFEYDFDRYVSIGNKSYGVKSDGTYEINRGVQINGEDITSHVIGVSATAQIKDKEYIRIRVNSSVKPDSIEFFKSIEEFASGVSLATLTASQLKNYYGFEQYIPREIINRDRIQGRHLLFDMINSTEIDFKIVDTEIQYKTLK